MRHATHAFASLAILLGLLCAYLAHELIQARALVQRESDQRHALEIQVTQLARARGAPNIEHASSRAPVQLAAESGSPAPATASRAPASAAATSPPPDTKPQRVASRGQVQAHYARIFADPAARDLLRAAQKAEARRANPDLAQALHLSPEMEDKLIDLIADQEMRRLEELARGIPDEAATQAASEERDRRNRNEIANLLGETTFAQYGAYQGSVPERDLIRALRARLDESDALHGDQAARLVSTLREERDAYVQQFLSARM